MKKLLDQLKALIHLDIVPSINFTTLNNKIIVFREDKSIIVQQFLFQIFTFFQVV
jgi:hypothetical protein